jgi:hypothetical protein
VKPVVKIRWSHDSSPESIAVADEILALFDSLPGLCRQVRQTESWTLAGRQARRRLASWVKRVTDLAQASGEPAVITKIQEVIFLLKGELPDHFAQN